MPVALNIFIHYGYILLFLWVATEQLGIPIPSAPLMLTAGTLTATHQLSEVLVVLAIILGALTGDSVWYFLGRRFGGSVVRLVCRLSIESAACVRKTESYFHTHGSRALLFAKFIPGFGGLAAPIAGQSGMPYRTFVQFDALGALLWSLTFTLVGRFFGDILKKHPAAWAQLGHFAGVLFVLLIVGFLAYRVFKQQAFLRQIRGAKVEPEELKAMMERNEPVYIIDLRHPLDYLPDPRKLPGAVLMKAETLAADAGEIPRDRDVVLYCTCPNDATSARTAMRLKKVGIYRVRPLHGGFEAWKKLGYPLEEMTQVSAA